MKRLMQYLPLALGIVGGVAILIYSMRPTPISVEAGRVTKGPLTVTVDEDGRTRVKERYVVSAPLSGVLGRIELHPGDVVEANKTILATIEPTNPGLLDARLLAEAESRVKAAEAAKEQSLARLTATREAHALAKHELDRAQSLIKTRAISQAEFDTAEHQERIAEASLRATEYGDRVASYELELAKGAFVRTRPDAANKDESQRLEIRSPVSGQVLRVVQQSSSVVQSGQALLEVGNTAELEIEIDVLSSDAARIKPGAKVMLEQWGGGESLQARVRLVEPSGFTKLSALGVEEQRVNVIADFVESVKDSKGLGDGYRVDARIAVWQTDDAIKVATGALFRNSRDWAVFVIKDLRAELRVVQVGHMNNSEAEVLEGLSPGEEVIEFPSDKVRDGTLISKRFE